MNRELIYAHVDGDHTFSFDPNSWQLTASDGENSTAIKIGLSFPLFFAFQPIGIMPPISSHAEC